MIFKKLNLSELIDLSGLILSLLWLVILALELAGDRSPMLFQIGTAVWFLLVLQFLYKIIQSKQRLQFIMHNPLFVLAVAVPLIRLFRLDDELTWLKYLTATSAAQLVWIFGSLSLGLKTLRARLRQQVTLLVTSMSLIVLFVGAAAMYHYESSGLHSYAESLWWTAMQMTTISSNFSPITPSGQIVALAISIFACGAFGLLTAGLATVLIGAKASDASHGVANQESVNQLKSEIQKLSAELKNVRDNLLPRK